LKHPQNENKNPFAWFDVSICVMAFLSSASQHSVVQLSIGSEIKSDASIAAHLLVYGNIAV